LTEVRQKIAEYLAGTYTAEDAVKEMQEAGLTEEEAQKYLSLLGYAVEVAKLLYWVEEIWDYVEQKEKEIEQATTVEELEQIEIKFPELEI
jgi:roadblock/LC7 domain-containing protein